MVCCKAPEGISASSGVCVCERERAGRLLPPLRICASPSTVERHRADLRSDFVKAVRGMEEAFCLSLSEPSRLVGLSIQMKFLKELLVEKQLGNGILSVLSSYGTFNSSHVEY